MKKLLLNLLLIAAGSALMAQSGDKALIVPVPSSSMLTKEKAIINPNAPKTLTCVDTLRYPQAKEQIVGNSTFYTFELWTADAEAMSQTYYLSGASVNITGAEFFGRRAPASTANLVVRASIYNVNASNVPTGAALGFATITIADTNYLYRQINFGTPITVTGNYAVVIEPTSTGGRLGMYINNAIPSQSYDEGLSKIKGGYAPSNGSWLSVPAMSAGWTGGPYDFEMLVAARVSYTINTNFTSNPSPGCVGSAVSFTNTTTPTSILGNRMFNYNAFETHFFSAPDSTYAWDAGVTPVNLIWSTNASYTYTAANTYNPTLYTLGGFWASCLDFQTNPIVINAAPSAPTAISGNNTICINSTNTFSINPVAGATSYTWTLPSGWTGSSTTTSISATAGTTGGTISVTATGPCGTSAATTLSVTVTSDNASFNYPSNTICSGGPNTTPTVNTSGSFSATPTGLVFANASTGEINVGASSTGVYTVTYTTTGACPNTSSQTINITTAPDASFSFANNSYCPTAANPSPIFGVGASAGVFSASPSGLSINSSTGQINLAASTAGTYTVTNAISASGSCPATSATTTVTVHPATNVVVSPSSPSICIGNTANLVASNASSYTWSPSTGLNQTTGASVLANPTINTTYTITGTDANGCTGTTNVTVTVNPLPTISVSPASATICNGASTSLTASGGSTYVWTPTTGLSSSTSANVNANPTTNTTYTVSGTDANGCSNTTTVTVNVNALPTVTFTLSNANVCSTAAPFALSGGSPAGGTYSGTGVSGGQFNAATAGVGTHTITYTYTDNNGCSASATQNITVSVCSGMEESSIAKSLLIAPNPAREQLMISFNNAKSSNVQVNIIAADGKLVYSENAAAATQYVKHVDVTAFAKGLYFIQIVSEEGMIHNKIIVQ